jgi:hypothetical protein
MRHGKAKWGVIIVGAVTALTLGAIGVASAASNGPSATPSPDASAQPGQVNGAGQGYGHGLDGDHDGQSGDHAGMLEAGGPGDLAEALADLSGKDEATIMQQRDAGKSFAELAKSYGVSETDLLAEATKIETAELDAAVKAGQLTDAQRTEILSGLPAHLKLELTETHTFDGHGPHGASDGDGPGGAGSTGTGAESSGTSGVTTQTSYLTY